MKNKIKQIIIKIFKPNFKKIILALLLTLFGWILGNFLMYFFDRFFEATNWFVDYMLIFLTYLFWSFSLPYLLFEIIMRNNIYIYIVSHIIYI